MSSTHKYIIHGPANAHKRMPDELFETKEPKFLYKYEPDDHNDIIVVAVFEEYEKQINASLTLTCIFTFTGNQTIFECEKTGGRVGFRGSSLGDEKQTVEDEVIKFIEEYARRFGLSIQQEDERETESNNSEE